jgi:hypothetical protein
MFKIILSLKYVYITLGLINAVVCDTSGNKTTPAEEPVIDSACLLVTASYTLMLLGSVDWYVWEEYATVATNTEPAG